MEVVHILLEVCEIVISWGSVERIELRSKAVISQVFPTRQLNAHAPLFEPRTREEARYYLYDSFSNFIDCSGTLLCLKRPVIFSSLCCKTTDF